MVFVQLESKKNHPINKDSFFYDFKKNII